MVVGGRNGLLVISNYDAIVLFHRLIQEEKETTEQRAEELESRVGSGNLELENRLMMNDVGGGARTPSGTLERWKHEQRAVERGSPPVSGRSTPIASTPMTPAITPARPYPTSQSRDALSKYNTVSAI